MNRFGWVLMLAVVGGCQCLAPVDDCGGKRCPVPPPYTCGDAGCDPIRQVIVDYNEAIYCDRAKACHRVAPDFSCAEALWGAGKWFPQPDYEEIIAKHLDAGTATFDFNAAEACIAQLKSCDSECDPFATMGTVPLGGTCTGDCQAGLYCDELMKCPGTCVKKPSAGDVPPDFTFCDQGYAQLVDGGVRCVDFVPAGGSCAAAADETDESERCKYPLQCTTHFVCSIGTADLQPCSDPDECRNPFSVCKGSPKVCTPMGNLGDPCSEDSTRGSWCLIGYSCSAPGDAGTCVLPYKKQGDPCDRVQHDCPYPLTCALGFNTCQPLSPLGGSCSSAYDCGDPALVCREGVCGPPAKAGESCFEQPECEYWLDCKNGTCVDPGCR